MMFEVYICGRKVKTYKFRIQAVVYLMLKGLCCRSRLGCWIDDRAEIRKVEIND